jgi:AcrR family transcriptional regulator
VGRPRQASDVELLKAAFRAIARLGPGRLTLAEVAREAGVSAPALVQRFGAKRALLLAAAADAASGPDHIFPELRARHASPVAALLGLADCMTLLGASPEAVANSLAFQQLGHTESEFRRHALAATRGMRAGIRSLVKDALASGELAGCGPERLASALHATLIGSLWNWLVHREGPMTRAIRRDLEAILAPYRTGRRRVRHRRARSLTRGPSGPRLSP